MTSSATLSTARPSRAAPVPDRSPAPVERIAALEAEVQQLRAAMASRASIEQAKGILMLLTGCGDQVAFDLLAHISSHTHRKVRDVAQAITDSASGHSRLPEDVCAIIRDACPPDRAPG
jgi:AmiR/NasT family two-component response regulator